MTTLLKNLKRFLLQIISVIINKKVSNMGKKDSKYKPLLFSTTVRNPARLKYFLKVIEKYDGQLLDDNLAVNIMRDCIQEKVYFAQKVAKEIEDYKKVYKSKDRISDELIVEVFDLFQKQCLEMKKPKERGFKYGASSRFKTCFELARKFGFVWFNEPEDEIQKIEFTDLGRELASECKLTNIPEAWDSEYISEKEYSIFLHALAKYQSNNELDRVLNEVNPLSLLLKTIKLLNKDQEIHSAGVSKRELAIFCFWKNNDSQGLYQAIRKLRKDFGFKPSDETLLDICDSLTDGKRQNSRQNKTILSEHPDDFMRKVIITGLLSRRGEGRYIDINKKKEDLADYIIEKYSSNKKFKSGREYFDYISKEDKYLLKYETKVAETVTSNELQKWSKKFGWETIKIELLNLKNKKNSKEEVLKDIIGYIRLEWLVSLAVKNKYPAMNIKANMKTDDEGVPYHQAGGGLFDIEVETDDNYSFIEVTMRTGADQFPHEINKIPRKIEETIFNDESKSKKTYFIAPKIHKDSVNGVKVLRTFEPPTYIENYDIEQFIEKLETSELAF